MRGLITLTSIARLSSVPLVETCGRKQQCKQASMHWKHSRDLEAFWRIEATNARRTREEKLAITINLATIRVGSRKSTGERNENHSSILSTRWNSSSVSILPVSNIHARLHKREFANSERLKISPTTEARFETVKKIDENSLLLIEERTFVVSREHSDSI